MEAGFRDSLEQRDQKASWTYLVSLLPKRKRSLRLPCAKAKDGWQGRQAPPPSLGFPAVQPPYLRFQGRSANAALGAGSLGPFLPSFAFAHGRLNGLFPLGNSLRAWVHLPFCSCCSV